MSEEQGNVTGHELTLTVSTARVAKLSVLARRTGRTTDDLITEAIDMLLESYRIEPGDFSEAAQKAYDKIAELNRGNTPVEIGIGIAHLAAFENAVTVPEGTQAPVMVGRPKYR